MKTKFVYLLTTGDGSDGDEWSVLSIHSTEELAKEAQEKYAPSVTIYGNPYTRDSEIEKWEVDKG